ncbi:MAG: MBL fold metallo-hydrolase, partial [Clostridia bacterium]|nr:MBL fold metallo-hydrolase [Clostridia bacterium]
GDDEVCTGFAELLHDELGYNSFAPYSGTEFDPAANEFIRITEGVPAKNPDEESGSKGGSRAKQLSKELAQAAKQLSQIARSAENISNSDKEKFIKELRTLIKKWSQ